MAYNLICRELYGTFLDTIKCSPITTILELHRNKSPTTLSTTWAAIHLEILSCELLQPRRLTPKCYSNIYGSPPLSLLQLPPPLTPTPPRTISFKTTPPQSLYTSRRWYTPTNPWNAGLISADRSNKATLLLTIPGSLKVVCNGFILLDI